METEQFKLLKAQFKTLTEDWKAARSLEERLTLNERIMDVLVEAQSLIERRQELRWASTDTEQHSGHP